MVVSLDRPEVKAGARVRVAGETARVIALRGRLAAPSTSAGSPVRALSGRDLDIAAGEYVSIMGPSGSGKSTLLNLLGCLDRPTAGSYRLDGEETAELSETELSRVRRHKIGFVFQFFHLVPRLTAAENVELPMVFAGMEPRRAARTGCARRWRRSGSPPGRDHRPDQLSGGERQRVAIARAVVMEPAILLADEPTGNLDSASGAEIVELIERMNARGLTLIVVTHDPDHRRAGAAADPAGRRPARRGRARRDGVDARAHRRPRCASPPAACAGIACAPVLSLLGVAIGVASVIMLTSLGEGARLYVTGEFASLGTNLLILLPGKTETRGGAPLVSTAPHDLTVDDVRGASRAGVPQIARVAPLAIGTAPRRRYGDRSRDVTVIGTTHDMLGDPQPRA